ncbi:MAG: hypothetical protein KF884_07595 [Fimbriimonadaceae bacterium]|nr:hypothetical protein [Fimbriimonadaceae bacterium]QYK57413.1 MAG: hypothetical protein KF884_07595 [Fimbriimonadaceae bacterium]
MKNDQAPYFDANKLNIQNRYVAWLDVMGSRSMMTRSLATSANFIFKLHVAAIRANTKGLSLYPMNDGVYAVGDDIKLIQTWVKEAFRQVVLANAQAKDDMTKVFLARAAVAFGPVADGRTLGNGAAHELNSNAQVKDAVLVGAPVVNAFLHERYASPFGVFVHESARTFAPPNVQPWSYGSYMRYWKPGKHEAWISNLVQVLGEYLGHCADQSRELDYGLDRIREHHALAWEYFNEAALRTTLGASP